MWHILCAWNGLDISFVLIFFLFISLFALKRMRIVWAIAHCDESSLIRMHLRKSSDHEIGIKGPDTNAIEGI